jgi:hypothetical protein
VHRYSRGIPRIINLLCEHALIVAYVEQARQITASMVEGVAAELDLDNQPFLISSASMNGDSSFNQHFAPEQEMIPTFTSKPQGRQER